jgi:hypothetical protein
MTQKNILISCLAAILVLVAIVGGIFLLNHDKTTPTTSTALTGCRAQTLQVGDSGNCVKDIQTMTNYMETADLTECPFTGSQTLPISGTYDSATEAQVKTVQTWASCYYKQEGMNLSISDSGAVDNDTWTELCDFAYTSPKQSDASTSPYTQASLAAGKNAHC